MAQCTLEQSAIRCDDDPTAETALTQCIGLLLVCRSDVLHLEPHKISLVPSAACSHFDDRQSDMVASRSRVVCLVSLAETSLAFTSIISKFGAEAISKRINVAFLRPNCRSLAQPRQLRMMASIASPARVPRPKSLHTGCTKPALNLLLRWSSRSCLIATCRGISQDSRGARHRPLDSRIKGARCAAVGRVTVQRLTASFLAWPRLQGPSRNGAPGRGDAPTENALISHRTEYPLK